MGLSNLGQTQQKTRDEISSPSSATYPSIVIFKEDIIVEENTTVIQEVNISGGFILGHHEFGILGTGVLGTSPTQSTATIRVTNPNNEYKEYIYMDFMFSTASTATINTTTQEIEI